ncbi:MAG: hypothetical protein KF813_03400 [Trueperaceae bacterium]|nr:hypothetical protein [Trueperaceae bacterium]
MTSAPSRFERKSMLQLSWPLLVVTLLTLLGALGNVAILSAASAELNAAVATANQLLGVLYDISVIFSIGALVVIAQHLGAGRTEEAKRAAGTALRASGILGVALALFIALAGPLLLVAVNTPPELLAEARRYLWVVAAGLAFNAYIVAATAVLRAYGQTVSILILGAVVNVLDIALLFLFVLVLDLGAAGAALPTLLVRGIGVILLESMVRRTTGTGLVPALRGSASQWWREHLPRMTRLSVPTVLENGAFNLAVVACVSFLNRYGTEAINARSYALTLTALVTGIILALAQGNETIVGWDVGARELRAAKSRTLRTAALTAAVAALLAALLYFGAEAALAIFDPDSATLAGARQALMISIVLLPASAYVSVVYGALRSAGDVVVPMVYSIAASALVMLPLSWFLMERQGMGVAGMFWALAASEAVKAALLAGRWVRGSWLDTCRQAASADEPATS